MNKSKLTLAALVLSVASITIASPSEKVHAETNPDQYVAMSTEELSKYLQFTKVAGGYLVSQTTEGSAYTGEFHIPSTHLGEPVIGVASSGFYRSKVTKIIFEKPEQITTIGTSAFTYINLENKLEFKNLSTIESSAFSYSKFSELRFNSNKIKEINDSAFRESTIPNELSFKNISAIHGQVFYKTKVGKLTFNPELVTSVGHDSFHGINSPETELHFKNLKTLGSQAFPSAHVKSIILPNLNTITGSANFNTLHQSTYVFIPNPLRANVSGPTYYGYIDRNYTPLGLKLNIGGIFTQHKIIMKPLHKDGSVDTNKPIKQINEYKKILYSGVDFEYGTAYSIEIYPLVGDTVPKIIIPMEPYEANIIDPLNVEVIGGNLSMELIDPHPLNALIDLSKGMVTTEVPITSTIRVKDFRGDSNVWNLQLALAPIYDDYGESIKSLTVYAEGLDVSYGQYNYDLGEYEFNPVRPKDSVQRLIGENSVNINPGGGFGIYDHKIDKLKVTVDPKKVELNNITNTVKLDTALIWTISTEL